MKILLISFEFPSETGFGGIATYTWYQSRALAKLGHEVHVLAGALEPTPLRSAEVDGVQVHRFRRRSSLMRAFVAFGGNSLSWTKKRIENAVSMRHGMKQLCQTHHFDIVEMPECGGEGAALGHHGMPTVIRLHSPSQLIMPFYGIGKIDTNLCSAIENRAIGRATAFSSCSQFLADEARQRMGISNPIEVIPNGIDVALFDESDQIDIRHKYGLSPNRLMILFAGRLERRKGIHLCADICMSILKDFDVDFIFAGEDTDGFFARELRSSMDSAEMKGAVYHLGKLDMRSLRSCMRQCDVFLLPSLWENCPYSCLEAMAAGKPIVSSGQGGMPELIHGDENGLLATSGDSASFVSQLRKLLDDADLRSRLGTAARRTVEASFHDNGIARLSLDHYQCVIDGSE
ncbi:glycosyltransferase family 4 protein [bacterium]|nr:glycosyltransferase family 4 protein [bacterium]